MSADDEAQTSTIEDQIDDLWAQVAVLRAMLTRCQELLAERTAVPA